MSKWQFSSTLASFLLLTDYTSIQLTSGASLNLFLAVQTAKQTVEFLLDNIALLNKWLQWQITEIGYVIYLANVINKANTIYWWPQLMCGVLAADLYTMAHGFDIEKQHWGRYKIMQKKSCQHQDYRKGKTGKYKIGKDRMSEHKHLAIFLKSCQCCDIGS